MTIRLLSGDCRSVLATLPDASVHCVVTSPPYYGLRDYGTAQWDGGDAQCSHTQQRRVGASTLMNDGRAQIGLLPDHKYTSVGNPYRDTCGKCGATRVDRQIGLEHSPEAYLQTMVQVFREVKRVLRPDGTVWCNIGDSYWNGGGEKRDGGHGFVDGGKAKLEAAKGALLQAKCSAPGLKPKDLLLMPVRLALALQADGWWVRSDIIWHKPNPMPESCTDRPTSAHEHVFLLTRSARYYYDQEGVRETVTGDAHPRGNGQNPKRQIAPIGTRSNATFAAPELVSDRNCRNVWTIATHAYSAAHFATFPPELASRCIRAGSSERGCCAQCGAPWRRVVERTPTRAGVTGGATPYDSNRPDGMTLRAGGFGDGATTTTGWSPSCTHGGDPVPCTVLDPFFGAGTTGLVASRLQRDCIGIDLNPDYNYMSRERIEADAPLFAAFPVADPAEARQAELWAEPLAAD